MQGEERITLRCPKRKEVEYLLDIQKGGEGVILHWGGYGSFLEQAIVPPLFSTRMQ